MKKLLSQLPLYHRGYFIWLSCLLVVLIALILQRCSGDGAAELKKIQQELVNLQDSLVVEGNRIAQLNKTVEEKDRRIKDLEKAKGCEEVVELYRNQITSLTAGNATLQNQVNTLQPKANKWDAIATRLEIASFTISQIQDYNKCSGCTSTHASNTAEHTNWVNFQNSPAPTELKTIVNNIATGSAYSADLCNALNCVRGFKKIMIKSELRPREDSIVNAMRRDTSLFVFYEEANIRSIDIVIQ